LGGWRGKLSSLIGLDLRQYSRFFSTIISQSVADRKWNTFQFARNPKYFVD